MRSRVLVRVGSQVNLGIILLIYFIVCLVSTTGVDVLMLLTAVLMVWATVREFANGILATAFATVLAMVAPGK